jgi:hypothetical protein
MSWTILDLLGVSMQACEGIMGIEGAKSSFAGSEDAKAGV